MNGRRYMGVLGLLLLLGGQGYGADVLLAWDAPTNNTDGTALVDLTSYEVDAIRLGVTAVIVSNRVQSLTFSPASTTTVTFAAQTNAPVGLLTETNKMTGLTSGLYVFRARAVSACGAESADSNACTNRVGQPATITLRVVK